MRDFVGEHRQLTQLLNIKPNQTEAFHFISLISILLMTLPLASSSSPSHPRVPLNIGYDLRYVVHWTGRGAHLRYERISTAFARITFSHGFRETRLFDQHRWNVSTGKCWRFVLGWAYCTEVLRYVTRGNPAAVALAARQLTLVHVLF